MSHHAFFPHAATKFEAELADEEATPLNRTLDQSFFHTRRGKTRGDRWKHFVDAFGLFLEAVLCSLLLVNVVFAFRGTAVETEDLEMVTFHERQYGNDLAYMSLDHKYDWLWADEMSGASGVIRLNPEAVDQEPAWGAIGMFHGLHCLTGIRNALQRAREGEDIGIDNDDDGHWPHCFYYLRQAILCAADDTIELPHARSPEVTEKGAIVVKRIGSIDGVNDKRSCRDPEALYELRARHGIVPELERWKILHNGTDLDSD